MLKLVIAAGELNVKGFGKTVAKIMGGTRLQRLAVVHHGLDGIGGLCTGKLFLIGFFALDYRNGQRVLAQLRIDV